jgi:hypothetical protein
MPASAMPGTPGTHVWGRNTGDALLTQVGATAFPALSRSPCFIPCFVPLALLCAPTLRDGDPPRLNEACEEATIDQQALLTSRRS